MRILKFPVAEYGQTLIRTKARPKLLTVGLDGQDIPSIWVEAEEGTGYTTYLETLYTGDFLPERALAIINYVGTIFMYDASLVLHVYEWYDTETGGFGHDRRTLT